MDETGATIFDHETSYTAAGRIAYDVTRRREGAATLTLETWNDFGAGEGVDGDTALGEVVSARTHSSRNAEAAKIAQLTSI